MNVTMNSTIQVQNGFVYACLVQKAQFFYIRGSVPTNIFVNHVICCIANVLLAFTTTFLNSVTLLTYWKSPLLREKVSYFTIMLLSIADLGVGIVGIPVFILQLVKEISGRGSCAVSICADILSTIPIGMSLVVLEVMTIERYIGVIHPIFHRAKVTKQRLLFLTIILWLLFFLRIFLRFYIDDEVYKIIISIDIVILAILALTVYAKIFCAWKTSTRVSNPSINTRSEESFGSQANSNRKSGFLHNVKQAKTFFIVVVCFFLCIIPQAIVQSGSLPLVGGAAVAYWSATFIMMNSSVNSLVLFWRNRILRNEARRVFRQLF